MCDTNFADENQVSFIKWLSYKLRDMALEILDFAICEDSDADSIVQQYRKYVKDSVNFMSGAHLCKKYLYGSIGLDEFCEEMLNEDLKSFLIQMPNLPAEIVVKYGLNAANNTDNLNGYGNETKDITIGHDATGDDQKDVEGVENA